MTARTGANPMDQITARTFDEPDESIPYDHDHGQIDIVQIGDSGAMRSVMKPGWSWDEDVKPYTDGWTVCQEHHWEVVLSGRMRYLMEDGSETVVGPGTFLEIPPGHRAWVEGDEDCVTIDW